MSKVLVNADGDTYIGDGGVLAVGTSALKFRSVNLSKAGSGTATPSQTSGVDINCTATVRGTPGKIHKIYFDRAVCTNSTSSGWYEYPYFTDKDISDMDDITEEVTESIEGDVVKYTYTFIHHYGKVSSTRYIHVGAIMVLLEEE